MSQRESCCDWKPLTWQCRPSISASLSAVHACPMDLAEYPQCTFMQPSHSCPCLDLHFIRKPDIITRPPHLVGARVSLADPYTSMHNCLSGHVVLYCYLYLPHCIHAQLPLSAPRTPTPLLHICMSTIQHGMSHPGYIFGTSTTFDYIILYLRQFHVLSLAGVAYPMHFILPSHAYPALLCTCLARILTQRT